MSAMLTMIWPMARNGFTRSSVDVRRWMVSRFDRGLEQGRAGHARPAGQASQLADRRGDVGEDSVVQPPPSTAGPATRIGTGLSE